MAKKKQTLPPKTPVSPSDPPGNFFANKKVRIGCYAGLFLLALAVRFFSNASHFFANVDPGYRNFEINDSSYQIRRTEITMAQYPRAPFYDSYHYYPDLPAVPWPPGYNQFLATVAKPFELLSPSRLMRESVIGVVPCVVDAITVVLFLFFFSRFLPFPVALLAAFLLSISTQNVGYSETGYIDHHYFITFLMAVFCHLLYFYDRKPSFRRAAVLGTVVGGAVYFNVSTIQYSILALLAVLFHAVMKRKEVSLWGPPLAVYAAAALASFASAFSTPAGWAWKLQYDETSLFQFFLILCCGVGYLIIAIWLTAKRKIILSMALIAVFGLLMSAAYQNILEGARFLFVGNILNSVQGEEASILEYYPLWPRVFTWFALLVPFGLWALLKKEGRNPFFMVVVLLFFAHGVLSGSAHFLYVQYLFPWFAVVAALGLARLMNLMRSWGGVRYVVATAFVIQAGYMGYAETANIDNGEEQARDAIRQTIRALAWLREHSPATSHHAKGDGPPEYSVFAHRDYGHQIARISHRPAVVSPFSTTAFVGHMKDYVRATFARNEEDMVTVMDRYHSRYLILDQRDNTMVDFLLGIVKGEPDERALRKEAESPVFLFRNNLLYFDGELRWKKTPSVKHFRLIYEVSKRVEVPIQSAQGLIRHRFNGLKIFERVPGAAITGQGYKPGERVIFRLPLKTNTNREFHYTAFTIAGSDGKISTTLPYSTHASTMSAVVPAVPVYEVERGAKKKLLVVSEEAVRTGGTLSVPAF